MFYVKNKIYSKGLSLSEGPFFFLDSKVSAVSKVQ
jgi:hypothetical protein